MIVSLSIFAFKLPLASTVVVVPSGFTTPREEVVAVAAYNVG
jgi:hypothetical protein